MEINGDLGVVRLAMAHGIVTIYQAADEGSAENISCAVDEN